MGGGGSDAPAASPYDIDKSQLSTFLRSGLGQQYAADYAPQNSYAAMGSSIFAYDPRDFQGQASQFSLGQNLASSRSRDVTGFMTAYQAWLQGNQQSQNNWETYAQTVAANSGGEGDNTITEGPAQSQRNVLLGQLTNAGVEQPLQRPGLGSMGAVRIGPGK